MPDDNDQLQNDNTQSFEQTTPDTSDQGEQVENGDQTRQQPTETDRLLDRFMENTDGTVRNRGQGPQRPQQNTQQGQGGNQPQNRNARGTQSGASRDVQQVPQSARRYGDLFYADSRGDIYNARGQLVARQGYGRSIFHSLYPYIEASSTENASLKQRLDNYERANEVARSQGLTIDDQGAAMQLMVQWKKNPLETINTLLRIATERGIDTSSVRSGGVDPAALRSVVAELFDERLKRFDPLVENFTRQREESEAHEAVVQEYNAFMEEFPDAAPHQSSIANVMRDRNMTHREAYFALRAFAAQAGLDWNSDLRPQLEARQSRNGQGSQNGQGSDRALPDMNGGRTASSNVVDAGSRDQSTGDESWDAIARRTLEKHGIRV